MHHKIPLSQTIPRPGSLYRRYLGANRFAVEEQPLFRLMFGQYPVLKKAEGVGEDYERVAPGLDVEAIIAEVAPNLLK